MANFLSITPEVQTTLDREKLADWLIEQAEDVVTLSGVFQKIGASPAVVNEFYCLPNDDSVVYDDNIVLQLSEELEIQDQEYYWTWITTKEQDETQSGIGVLSKQPLIPQVVAVSLQGTSFRQPVLSVVTEVAERLTQIIVGEWVHSRDHYDFGALKKAELPLVVMGSFSEGAGQNVWFYDD